MQAITQTKLLLDHKQEEDTRIGGRPLEKKAGSRRGSGDEVGDWVTGMLKFIV